MPDGVYIGVRPDASRLLHAFQGAPTDRVPYWDHEIGSALKSYVLGRPLSQAGITAAEYVEFAQRIGMDAIGFGIGCSIGRVSRQASDGTWHYVDGSIKTWDNLRSTSLPDPEPSFERLECYLEAVRGTDIGVWAYSYGPFDPTYLAMGYTDFMLALYDDLPLVEAIMDLQLEYNIAVFKRLCRYPMTFLMVGEDISQKDGLMVRPELHDRLWLPRMQQLIAAPKAAGIPLLFHSDGQLRQLLPWVAELGFSAIHPIEPYSNDIYAIKRQWGSKITLAGNIDIAGPLAFGTPSEVREDVCQHMQGLKPGGRWVMCSSNSVTDNIPGANYQAMLEAWRDYGSYESDECGKT